MTPEQKALLQKATASLQAARLLADQAFYDFAISRAYYTMFYVAEAFLLGEGLVYSKHSAVTAAFGQRFVKTGRVPPQFHRYLIHGQGFSVVQSVAAISESRFLAYSGTRKGFRAYNIKITEH